MSECWIDAYGGTQTIQSLLLSLTIEREHFGLCHLFLPPRPQEIISLINEWGGGHFKKQCHVEQGSPCAGRKEICWQDIKPVLDKSVTSRKPEAASNDGMDRLKAIEERQTQTGLVLITNWTLSHEPCPSVDT